MKVLLLCMTWKCYSLRPCTIRNWHGSGLLTLANISILKNDGLTPPTMGFYSEVLKPLRTFILLQIKDTGPDFLLSCASENPE